MNADWSKGMKGRGIQQKATKGTKNFNHGSVSGSGGKPCAARENPFAFGALQMAKRNSQIGKSKLRRISPKSLAKAAAKYLAGKNPAVARRLIGKRSLKYRMRRGRLLHASRIWERWELAMLGRVSDKEVARRIGRTRGAVKHQRLELGIPCAPVTDRWTPAEIKLLGTMADRELAVRLKRTIGAVKAHRNKLRIHAVNSPMKRWTRKEIALLGKFSDSIVAARLGRSRVSTSWKRSQLGIPLQRPIVRRFTDEERALLGTATDIALARRLKRSVQTITKYRKLAGIPRCSIRAPRYNGWKAHEIRLLGTLPDREVANRTGRTPEAVKLRRCRLGIPRFRLRA